MKNLFRFFSVVIFASILLSATAAQTTRPNHNRTRTFDVQHYIISTSFDRKQKVFYGDTTIKFKPLTNKFRILELDAEGLKFTSVKLENNKELISRVTEDKIFITLDKEYAPDDLVTIRLIYTAKPTKGVYFVDDLKKDGKVIRASQVWTQGEAIEARHWFPSYDLPDDKATTEQFITVNKGETAIANGELKDVKDNADGTQTFHYYMSVPHSTYLTSFVVGTYTKIEDKYKQIPLSYYLYPDRTEVVANAYGKTKEMMRIFEELTKIDYPFNKYDQTIVANFTFGGMENVSATTMADTEILLANFPFARASVEDLVSHELAHSWFGNLVTCKNWSELWLNEGFATFMEAAYREKMYGRANYIRKIKDDVAEFLIEDSYNKNQHALFNANADPKDDSIFDSITYKKGGAVIHTLRETIGDEAFWRGINLYLERHKFGNVESTDLQKAFEESSKTDLSKFFSQWVYSSGFPKLNIKSVYNTKTKELELTVTQIQKTDSSTPEAFDIPLEIEINSQSGTNTEKIELKKRSEVFKFNINNKPLNIILDKNEKIPLKTVKMQNLIVIAK